MRVKRRARPHVWLLACLVVSVPACSDANAATVGDVEITREALDRELDAIRANEKYVFHLERKAGFAIRDGEGRFSPPLVAQVVTNKIRRAVTMGLSRTRRVRATADERREGLVTAQGAVGGPDTLAAFPRWFRDALVDYETAVIAVSRSLVDMTPEQYYRRAKDAFVRACASHIATETRDQAVAALHRIEAGESFASVARSVSRDEKTASKDGELGCAARGDLQSELDQLAFSLRVGEVSDPVNIGGAFHLLMVSERETPPLDQIRGEIGAALRRLGASRFDALLKERLVSGDVSIAGDVGVWDPSRLLVLPPGEEPGPSPTPRPRPLPRVAVSSDQVDPNYQVGQQIFITDEGLKPRELVSIVEEEITWTNETDSPKTIRFVVGGTTIGPIEPGETGSYTPQGALSIAYGVVEDPDTKGLVQVQVYFAPGEDPGAPDRLDADTPIPGTATPWAPESP